MRPRVRRPTARAPKSRYAPTAARSASWYLDPVVARQKAAVFLDLVERWRDPTATGPVLKTDLFEEANGEDALVPGLEDCVSLVGLDLDLDTARRARRRFAGANLAVVVADMRRLGVRDSVFDLVVSPSTLDHFKTGLASSTATSGRSAPERDLQAAHGHADRLSDDPGFPDARVAATLQAVFPRPFRARICPFGPQT